MAMFNKLLVYQRVAINNGYIYICVCMCDLTIKKSDLYGGNN